MSIFTSSSKQKTHNQKNRGIRPLRSTREMFTSKTLRRKNSFQNGDSSNFHLSTSRSMTTFWQIDIELCIRGKSSSMSSIKNILRHRKMSSKGHRIIQLGRRQVSPTMTMTNPKIKRSNSNTTHVSSPS